MTCTDNHIGLMYTVHSGGGFFFFFGYIIFFCKRSIREDFTQRTDSLQSARIACGGVGRWVTLPVSLAICVAAFLMEAADGQS